MKHPTRGCLSSASPEIIAEYCDYLMGDTVRGLQAKSQNDEVVARLGWQQILHYDFHIQKEHARLIVGL